MRHYKSREMVRYEKKRVKPNQIDDHINIMIPAIGRYLLERFRENI